MSSFHGSNGSLAGASGWHSNNLIKPPEPVDLARKVNPAKGRNKPSFGSVFLSTTARLIRGESPNTFCIRNCNFSLSLWDLKTQS